MNLQQLKYFVVTAKHLHYTKAAKELYVSQPSISTAITNLEMELGVKLFERAGNRIALTAYGEAFLGYATQSLTTLEEGIRNINDMAKPSTLIKLGCIYSLSFDYLPKVVCQFQDRLLQREMGAGEVALNINQNLNETLFEKLQQKELDFIFNVKPEHEGYESVPVYEQELFLAVPKHHPLSQTEKVELSRFAGESFISISSKSSLRTITDNILAASGIRPKSVLEAEECNAIAALVGNGFGVAIIPYIPALNNYNVTLLRVTDVPMKREIHFVWRKANDYCGIAKLFKDYMLEGSGASAARPTLSSPTALSS